MKHLTAILALALLLPGCASRQQEREPNYDMFGYEYHFEGHFDGQRVTGTIAFTEMNASFIRYRLISDVGLCTNELRPPTTRWVQLSCGGMSIQFARAGRVIEHANATLRTTRQAQRRECSGWTTNDRGQRVCTGYRTVTVDVPTTARGTLHVQRVDVG